MRRLYFLIPDVELAKRVVDELLLARVPERRIHIVAKDHRLLQENAVPEAGLLQESDVLPAIEKGLAAGGTACRPGSGYLATGRAGARWGGNSRHDHGRRGFWFP
jgi:hypothetical protein